MRGRSIIFFERRQCIYVNDVPGLITPDYVGLSLVSVTWITSGLAYRPDRQGD